ncbi:NAD(P)/FAD-dependent oxidoreductase [uncultured Algibacter sp.]|uniref:NAD(P)/FAD-dependent oxidoreductase n=1 Tax=uncultured Algibacter sp. TaxID=298659 RepID=UPI00321763BD
MADYTQLDIIVIGGGLAGLTSAIKLSKAGFKVVLIEKNTYPKHKVCGEYISNEVLPYLKSLGFNPFDFGAKHICDFELTTIGNKSIKTKLPLGGFGMSRYEMDYQLYKIAIKNQVDILHDVVNNVQFKDDVFTVKTKFSKVFKSRIAIGAFGKRSNLDVEFKRKFITKKSPYLGVKIHVSGHFPEDKVALHNFKGGYCGVSKVENNHINLCYIANFKSFKKYKDINTFQEEVLFKNSALKSIFKESVPQFEQPLTISQISFKTKNPVENHILMCGDTAGMIHPLCGHGMSMAIRSGQLASTLIIDYLHKKIKTRTEMEKQYSIAWRKTFNFRLKIGHTIAYLFRQDWLAYWLLNILRVFPFLLLKIIKMTHGKPMKP